MHIWIALYILIGAFEVQKLSKAMLFYHPILENEFIISDHWPSQKNLGKGLALNVHITHEAFVVSFIAETG